MMNKVRSYFAVLSLAIACTFSATPAHASGTAEGWFDFAKNKVDQTDSRLTWQYIYDSNPKVTYRIDLVRAGSGLTRNECEVGKGWLPNGWYDQLDHENTYVRS